ncbi:MAG: glycosyltransferase family 4 protein [Holosporales bacterium]|jgi:glycosyltransferase involved in cell wall biosynthesis|nr:glycosyltransferase family 4 protein [Holosporales bacterium]
MKLLFTIPTLRQGGSERVILVLTEILSKRHRVMVAVQDKLENCFYSLSPKVKLISTDSLKKIIPSTIRLRKIIKDYGPNVIISFLMQQNIITLAANLNLGIPLVVSERTSKECYDSFVSKTLSLLGFFTYRFADQLTVQTAKIKKQFDNIKNKVRVIANPVILPEGTYQSIAREKLIIAAGRLIASKNYDLLIDSFSQLASDFPDWRLEIWGGGKEKDALQQQINQHNLSGRVQLCGTTKDIYSVLRKSSIFVMPSRFEGFPNALCEAMLAGLPVIYSNISGADELIKPGETGLLINSGDVHQLVESMKMLIENPELRDQLGSNAKKHIQDNYAADKIATQWEMLFQDLLEARRSKIF